MCTNVDGNLGRIDVGVAPLTMVRHAKFMVGVTLPEMSSNGVDILTTFTPKRAERALQGLLNQVDKIRERHRDRRNRVIQTLTIVK